MYIFKSITRTVRMLALAAAAVGITSCAEDISYRPAGGKDTTDGEISVLYEVDGDIPLTRGIAATEHEMELKDVYILYFDNDSDPDKFGKFAGYTRTKASNPSTLRFDTPDGILDDHDYRLLVVGNADAYTEKGIDKLASRLDAMLASSDKTYDITEVHKDLLAYSEDEVTSGNPGVLPMCGRFVSQTNDQEIIFRISRSPEGVTIPSNCIFRFQRAICRIDIHNLVGDVLDIKYVRLVNTRDHGAYFYDGLNRGDFHEVKFTTDGVNPAYIEMPEAAQLENGATSKLQRLEAEMYCFPNTRNTCLPNDTETTAMMIAGYYIEPDTHVRDTELTYYRFNLSNAGDAQTLQRNYCYRATIKGVRQRGYETEDKAYNATSPIFTYDISEEWDTDDDNVVTDEYGNFLVVSKSLLTFTGDQCGADVVKLTVNVSDNMSWRLEMSDEETKRWFQAEPIKGAESETIKAFTCGPREENHTQYYREGLLTIVATNTKTGSELRKDVRLVQLTTNGDVKCLVVNDYMSDFVQEVSKYGQTISYKVITGNQHNRWTATLVSSNNLDTDRIIYNFGGTNANLFTITFPANIKEKGNVAIKFEFICDDEEYNNLEENEKIKPIIVTFNQEKCELPMSIEGWPNDGVITFNCFDTRTGYEYANCVTKSKRFTVHLYNEIDHYVEVTSTFDQWRDLTLSEEEIAAGYTNDIRSIHPGLKINIDSSIEAGGEEYKNTLNLKNSVRNTFFINAFRMGPGDEPIEGQITVHVKDRETDEDVPNGQLTLTVKLEVPKDEYMINDVMIKHELYSEISPSVENGWIYIMDRNLGCDARMTEEDGIIRKNEAMWCFYDGVNYAGEDDRVWIITNTTNSNMKENPTKWLGNLDFPPGTSHRYQPTQTHYNTWKSILKNQYKHLGRMYEDADNYPWLIMTSYTVPSIRKNTAISKGRHFILADEEVCPMKNGKKVRVACWLPSGCRIGYAFQQSIGSQFAKKIVLCGNRGKMIHSDFWPNNTGYYDGGDAYYSHGRLIRLMYMVGYVKDSSGNPISAEYTLSKDREKDELEYYKEHILKCYEQ